jgi:hypothetical protein
MKPLVKGIPIGAQDFGRIKSRAYMKKNVFARKVAWVFPAKEEAKHLL